MQSEIHQIHSLVEGMQQSRAMRDQAMAEVRMVRRGEIDQIRPEHFADSMPKSIVANIIDVAARDTAELVAPLPALACASGNMTTASDAVRASKKNKIGSWYWSKSNLAIQNISFADSILTYGFGVYLVEADLESRSPRIRFLAPFGTYYFKDRWGQLVWLAQVAYVQAGALAAQYPEHADRIMRNTAGGTRVFADTVRLVTYLDRHQSVVYLPDSGCHVIARAQNPIGRVPAVVAERNDLEDAPRGQFNDAVWPALAKARMALYMLQAADKSINAPIVYPDDTNELNFGPGATIRTSNPAGVRRVALDIPQDVFAIAQTLDRDVKEGARYPEARTGGIKGSIVTGRGVQELMGTMDTQVRTMQAIVGQALELATSLCFELDCALWGSVPRKITGVITGKPYELTYNATRDIGDSYDCKTTYGFAAGQTPAQAMVALLQLRGDNQISRDTARRQLPFDIDPEEEQRSIDVQEMEDAAKQGLMALTQAFGPMVMQGQNPTPILVAMAKTIMLREKGKRVSEALLEAFKQAEPEPEPAEMGMPPEGQAPPGPGGELPPGVRPNGLPQGVPYGQQGMAPGGMPAVSALMATLRGDGKPMTEATIIRKRATGSG